MEHTMDDLRTAFTQALKASMKAGDTARTGTLRMILARVKDVDIAARPTGTDRVPDADVLAALRHMVKQRRDSIVLYQQGNRPELAAREQAEIEVIEAFLPRQMDEQATEQAVRAAIAHTNAASIKDMGRVMAALKAGHGAALDMALVNRLVRAALDAG